MTDEIMIGKEWGGGQMGNGNFYKELLLNFDSIPFYD